MIVAVQRIRRLGTKGGQRIEDLLNFVLFPAFQQLQLVICLDDGDRLDEHGRAGCRCIMHKPLDLVPVLHLDRHDVAVVAHGHDVFLQQLSVAAADKLLQRVLDLVVRRADLAADLGKLGACLVRDLILGEDGARDGIFEAAIRHDERKGLVEYRLKRLVGLAVVKQRAAHAQKIGNLEQFERLQHRAASGTRKRPRHVADAAERRVSLGVDQTACIRRHLLTAQYGRLVPARHKAERLCPRPLGERSGSKQCRHLVIFQHGKCFLCKCHIQVLIMPRPRDRSRGSSVSFQADR